MHQTEKPFSFRDKLMDANMGNETVEKDDIEIREVDMTLEVLCLDLKLNSIVVWVELLTKIFSFNPILSLYFNYC